MKKLSLLFLTIAIALIFLFKDNLANQTIDSENSFRVEPEEFNAPTTNSKIDSNKINQVIKNNTSVCTKEYLQALSNELASPSNKFALTDFFSNLSKTYEPDFELDLFLVSSGYGLKRMRYLSKKNHKDVLLPQPYNGASKMADNTLHLKFKKILKTNNPSIIIAFIEDQLLSRNVHFFINGSFTYPTSLILNSFPLSNKGELDILIGTNLTLELSDLIVAMKLPIPDKTLEDWVESSNIDVSASFYWKEEKRSLVLEALKLGRYKLALDWYVSGAKSSPELLLRNALDVIAMNDGYSDPNAYKLMKILILNGESPNYGVAQKKLKQKISDLDLKEYLAQSVSSRKAYINSSSLVANKLYQNLQNMVFLKEDKLSKLCFQKALLAHHRTVRESKNNNVKSMVNVDFDYQLPSLGGELLAQKQKNAEKLKQSISENSESKPGLRDSFEEDVIALLDKAFQNALNGKWSQAITILDGIELEEGLLRKTMNQFLNLAIATNADLEIFDFLFRKGAKLSPSSLLVVVQNDNLELAQYLLNKGLEFDRNISYSTSPLKAAIENKSVEMVTFLLGNMSTLVQEPESLDGLNITLMNYRGTKVEGDIIKLFLKYGYILDDSHIDSLRAIKKKSNKSFVNLIKILEEYGAL